MSGLLVSVRDAEEAAWAVSGGAAALDVKEPLRGALGAADASVWASVRAAVDGRVPLSAALGELLEGMPADALQLRGYCYAKAGLAGCAGVPDWPVRWQAIRNRLPAGTELVAVAYADHERAESPPLKDVVRAADELGIGALLIDTFDKRHGNLLAHLRMDQLRDACTAARQCRMLVVLGGSLDLAAVRQLLPLAPDWFAVRSGLCRAERTGIIDADRVRQFAAAVAGWVSDPIRAVP